MENIKRKRDAVTQGGGEARVIQESSRGFPAGLAHYLGFCLEWDGAVVSCSCPPDRVWDAQYLVQHLF